MKIAIAQTRSTESLTENLKRMQGFVEQASSLGAELLVFPEMAYFSAKRDKLEPVIHRYEEFVSLFSEWALKYKIALVPGTLREPDPQNPGRYFNTLHFFCPEGKNLAKYQKIFRFEAHLPHHTYQESRYCTGGNQITVAPFKNWVFGFAICFDLRFPELFRSLRKRGARVFVIPSAFTVPTGKAHWEILLRARAIENQAYVIAVDQTSVSGEGLSQYGHSLVIDPWGRTLTELENDEALAVSEIFPEKLQEAESQIAAWPSRDEVLFPIA